MKRLTLYGAAAAVAFAFAASPANAEIYGKISAGDSAASINGVDLNDHLAYGAALGANAGPVRVEAGVDRIAGDFSFGGPSLQAHALDYHATAYLDLPLGHNTSIFGGAGVDYVDGQASLFGSSIRESGKGWHWAAGVATRLNDRMIAEVQVRQITASLDGDIGSVDLDATETTAALRFKL